MGLKRLLWALFALVVSTSAFADDYSDDAVSEASADNCVMIPMQQGGFKIGVDALYLRPTNSDLDYAAEISFPSNFTAGLENNNAVDPAYDWGFYVQIGYLMSCTGNDITLAYTYLRNNESNFVTAIDPVLASGPIVSVLPVGSSGLFGLGIDFRDASGQADFDLNAVDLEFGQRITTGSYDLRMFAGLRYASINHQLKAIAGPFDSAAEGSNTAFTGFYEYKNEYSGFGPRFGVDARYCLSSGFGIDANVSTSLLVGSLDSTLFVRRSSALLPPIFDFGVENKSIPRIVPVLEAKLGLDYAYVSDCQCKSTWVFEAGYQVTNYFNVVDRPKILNAISAPDPIVPPPPVGTVLVQQNNTSDIAFDGPYLGIKYYA